jgi:hypothetical protein
LGSSESLSPGELAEISIEGPDREMSGGSGDLEN